MTLIQIETGVSGVVSADWEAAIHKYHEMDNEDNYDNSNEVPFDGAAIVRLLGEYGLGVRKAANPPEGTCLVIVVWPPEVWFCPNQAGLDGVFVEQYSQAKHGVGIKLSKPDNIWDYSNLDAKRDGWFFWSQMVFAAQGGDYAKSNP